MEPSASAYVISDASGQQIARFDAGVPGDGAALPARTIWSSTRTCSPK
nr:hypothetical protein [Arthrobacter sp. CAL618]